MSNEKMPNLTIRNCKLIWRNFAGKAGKFTPEGRRTFNIVLDEETAHELLEDGWNVKIRPSREEGEEEFCTLPVLVRFDNFPPRVYMISNGKKIELDEDSVNVLDYAELTKVDLTLSPYHWQVGDKEGIKAYLKTMYATLVVDELAAEYSEYDDYNDHPRDDDLPFDI